MKKTSSSVSLRHAIASLEATAAQVTVPVVAAPPPPASPLTELRAWRLGMAKRYVGLSIMSTSALSQSPQKAKR
jgi:hypothetical protein